MPKLQTDDKPSLKNNVLPFPALMAAPKDPPPVLWRGLAGLVAIAIGLGLLALTLWALFL